MDIYIKTAKDLLTKSGSYLEAKKTPLLGTEWASEEAHKFLSGVADLEPKGNFLVESAKVAGKILDAPGKVYQGSEQLFKLAVFNKKREDGMSIKAAAKHAEKTIFNYQKIPPGIRWAKRWYSPFITFSYKAMPRFAEAVVRKPWRIATIATLLLAVEETTRRMAGESKEEVEMEKKILPDYMRKSVLPGQLSHLRVPYKDEYGRSKYLDLSFILPWGDVAEQWGQSRLVGRPFLPSHPLYISIAEIAFNEIMFTGQDLTKKDIDEGSDYLKKIGTQLWRQAMPSLAGSYSFNKLMAAYKGEPDWALRERSMPEAIFDVFLGLKVRSIDYNEQLGFRMKEYREALGEVQERFAKQYKKIVFTSTPDAERDQKRIVKLYEQLNEDIDKITRKMESISAPTGTAKKSMLNKMVQKMIKKGQPLREATQ